MVITRSVDLPGYGRIEAREIPILAIGRRGSPRKLGAPGEDSPTVAYALGEPSEVRGQTVLVVGGGNSALEAAAELGNPALANTVVLSYRGGAFGRATPSNRGRVEELQRTGRLTVLWRSSVLRIEPRRVDIEADGGHTSVAADRVYVMIGGELPGKLLRGLGVEVDVEFGTA